MKWVYLENLSTTVSKTLLPCTLGSASIKSIEISAHTQDGTGNGWRRPAGCSASVLLRWQVEQART
jgi:hypothetical protein